MSGTKRGAWAGLTFLIGFAATLWLAGAAIEALRGPRAGLMRELNGLRDSARIPALRPDPHLGRLAQQHARDLARGSALALARGTPELERSARSAGWKGSSPLREIRLRGADPRAALHQAALASAAPAFLEVSANQVGVGLAPAPSGDFVAVILTAP